ncbi:MAG: radical SAM protein [Candidatus Riflebacteria bacterium]|nr:radical SAM protein [Candidatus Riflebacteria bacterium]
MLKIARKTECCKVLGPGDRAVIWFYGCSRNCDGCIAKSMNHSEIFAECTPEDLYEWVKNCNNIEGLSISGGEPLEQNIDDLIVFLKKVKSDSRKLSVILFTGFTYDEIVQSELKIVLPFIDVLIDGTYKKDLNDDAGLRGSSNQVIHFLSERYKPIKESFYKNDCRNVEVGITLDNVITINGIPKRGFIEKLTSDLAEEGYDLK